MYGSSTGLIPIQDKSHELIIEKRKVARVDKMRQIGYLIEILGQKENKDYR